VQVGAAWEITLAAVSTLLSLRLALLIGAAAVEVADFDDGFWGGHFWGGRGEEFDRISGLTGFHSLCWLFEG
jgi:hypothetical protein